MNSGSWVKELPAEVMVCDSSGVILAMNDQAEVLFADDGGKGLLGANLLDCHPDTSLQKLQGMLADQSANCYFNTRNGEKRFFFQSPWYRDGRYSGFVEISFPVPENIPHFIRE
jgi:nitrogen fixation/metabolism regulation signal transduction histidine kinase